MNAPMCKVQKEGAMLIYLNDLQCLVCPIVGQITTRFERITTVKAGGKTSSCPQKFVDRIEGEFCVDDVRIVFFGEELAIHQ